MANMTRSSEPFDREPIEREYRMRALAGAIHMIADFDAFERAETEIRSLSAAIEDEATALIEEMEKAERESRGH